MMNAGLRHWRQGVKLHTGQEIGLAPMNRLCQDRGGFRSTYGDIFAAGDTTRIDRSVARSGVHAVRAGPVLAANLRASLTGSELRSYIPKRRTLYLLATGDKRAILSWDRSRRVAAIWRLKDWIDRVS